MLTKPRTIGKILAALVLAAMVAVPTTAISAQPPTHTAPGEVTVGSQLTITGTGWLNQAGTEGSVVAVKLDSGGESATFQVVNPANGNVVGNKTIWAIGKADNAGNLALTFPLPDGLNNASGQAWEVGTTHQYTLLSGSLLPGDAIRSVSGSFKIVAGPQNPTPGASQSAGASPKPSTNPGVSTPPVQEPSQGASASASAGASPATPSTSPGPSPLVCTANELRSEHRDEASGQTAVVCVQREVATTPGAKFVVRGAAWSTKEPGGGALVVIKLGSRSTPSAADFQFARTGDNVLKHPRSGAPDASIWAVVRANADGTFEAELDVPQAINVPESQGGAGVLKAGSKLVVNLRTGLNPTDVRHDITTDSLVVNKVPYVGDATEEQVPCEAGGGEPKAWVEYPAGQEENPLTGPILEFGAKLRLRGTGWCHNSDPAAGGAVIGVKIDEGAFSRIKAETVSSNATIWAIVKVNSADGSFDTEITLPTAGTGAGSSTPQFTQGSHTLRLLTGSLKPAGTSRTLKTNQFTVGTYQPNGLPKLLSRGQALAAPERAMVATLRGKEMHVELPGQAGAWLFLSGFAADGSPRFFTNNWIRLDSQGRGVAQVDLRQIPTGEWTVLAQLPTGEVAGWVRAYRQAVPPAAGASPSKPAKASSGTPTVLAQPTIRARANAAALLPAVPAVPAVPAHAVKPVEAVALPVASISELRQANRGEISARRQGAALTLTLPASVPVGAWVALHLYPLKVSTDWLQVDQHNQVHIDLTGTPEGGHRIAVTDHTGALLGWVGLELASATASASASASATPAVPSAGATAQVKEDDAAAAPAFVAAEPGAENESELLSLNDWLLIAAAVVILLGAGGAYALLRSPRTR